MEKLEQLRKSAQQNQKESQKNNKSSKQKGLYKQIHKTLTLLQDYGPRYPGLRCHAYNSLESPYDNNQKVFEAYAQNHTPGAYRIFWCYGPYQGQLTIIAITPHP